MLETPQSLPSLQLLVQAAFIGLAIAAPVGPIGLLVIQRTLRSGLALGLATGLGAAVADAAYAALGAWGAAGAMQRLHAAQVPLTLAGAAFLAWLAWRTWRTLRSSSEASSQPVAVEHAQTRPASAPWAGLLGAFSGTFVLTLANPATVLSFVAIFASFGPALAQASPAWVVAGVFVGSALWWLALCLVMQRLRRNITEAWRVRIGQASALLLALFALAAVVQLVLATALRQSAP
jgi:threonine/homoserine/homoserine lactone efflux protein